LAEAEVEYQDKTSDAIDVRFQVADVAELEQRLHINSSGGSGLPVSVPIWTTTPWTLPANQAVTLGDELDYELVEVSIKGHAERLVLAAGLAATALDRYAAQDRQIIASFKGVALRGLLLLHPFYAREVPIIIGDFVTLDAGTGAVHTAPGHGHDDFNAGVENDLPLDNPVDGRGIYLHGTELFAGMHIYKANQQIVELMDEEGALLHGEKLTHSYPHCWRHKSPLIFRATPQWFVSLDQNGLRTAALDSVEGVRWIPDWGQQRIKAMIAGRPDWCISRQRTWGVPIPLFTHRETDEIHPDTPRLLQEVADRVQAGGIDAWFDLETAELLGDDADKYQKVPDTMDVWMDSGMVHHYLASSRDEIDSPVDLYLEGSDQHRGWFQSSLLTSIAMDGRAPYRQVLTHGFTVDEKGRKMSKSLGNTIVPQTVVNSLGADILRLWVAATDYSGEMSVSDEIMKRIADSYRRIRNTARFLLGNLHEFDPQTDLLAATELVAIDRWALHRAAELQHSILSIYDDYDFHRIYQELHNFCVVDMGGFYLDIIKDRLYTTGANSHPRRSAQTAMYHIAEAMVRWIAPILSFTGEEIWRELPGERPDSVFLDLWYEFPPSAVADTLDWSSLIDVRETASKVLEELRVNNVIGSGLDAGVTVYADGDLLGLLQSLGEELRFLFITSEAQAKSAAQRPDSATAGDGYWVSAESVGAPKCVRCWHRRPDVGAVPAHTEICGRCAANVDGPGEVRLFA